jgi:hypothetical protein
MMRLRFWTSCGRSVVSVGLTGVDIRQFGNSQWRGSHTAVFDRQAPRRDWPVFRTGPVPNVRQSRIQQDFGRQSEAQRDFARVFSMTSADGKEALIKRWMDRSGRRSHSARRVCCDVIFGASEDDADNRCEQRPPHARAGVGTGTGRRRVACRRTSVGPL